MRHNNPPPNDPDADAEVDAKIDAYFAVLADQEVIAPNNLENKIADAISSTDHLDQTQAALHQGILQGLLAGWWWQSKGDKSRLSLSPTFGARILISCLIPLALGFSAGFSGVIDDFDSNDYEVETYLYATSLESTGADDEF